MSLSVARQPICDEIGVGLSTAKAECCIRKIKLKTRKAPFQNGSRCFVVI